MRAGRHIALMLLIAMGLMPVMAVEKRTTSDKYISLRYRLSGTVGWLNRDDKIAGDKNTIGLTMDRPVVTGATFAVEFLSTGNHKWLQQWNNASVGLALTFLDLGQDQYLGQAFAPHTYLNIPLARAPHMTFGLRPGVGLGFVTKRYANTVPPELLWKQYRVAVSGEEKKYQQVANVSVGSIMNAFLTAGFYFDFPIRDGWDITFSAAWQHMSNGSTMTPNAGYNMFNAEIGAAYTPNTNKQGLHHRSPDPMVPKKLYDGVHKKKWEVEIGIGGGARSIYYQDQKWYGIASLSLAAFWKPVGIFRLGAGADLFYDGAYIAMYHKLAPADTEDPVTHYGKTYIGERKYSNCFRLGVSIQPEFVVGNLTFGYHIGVYLVDPIKNLEPFAEVEANGGKPLQRGIFYAYDPAKVSNGQDGWCYQKVQIKYHCSQHIYLQAGLKLHLMKAEFIDFGLGVRI